MMKGLLILLACFGYISCVAQLQPVQLQLKKKGRVKKRIYIGTIVLVKTSEKEQIHGTITGLKDSIIFINGAVVPVNNIRTFRLVYPRAHRKINGVLLAYTSLGVAVSAIGMKLSKREKMGSAIVISSAIGYSPFLLNALARKFKKMILGKDNYRIGRRFSLCVWDIN